MSRSIKNRNILNIAESLSNLKYWGPWEYEWVDGGDGFLYRIEVYDETKRGQWLAKHHWQRERLPHYVTGRIKKTLRHLEEKTYRQKERRKIQRYACGLDEDVIADRCLHNQPWTW